MTELLHNVPLAKPTPDANRFIDLLMGRTRDGPVPLVEYLVDEVVMRPIVTELIGREWIVGSDRASQRAYYDNFISFWYRMGYDFCRFEQSLDFSITGRSPIRTSSGSCSLPSIIGVISRARGAA